MTNIIRLPVGRKTHSLLSEPETGDLDLVQDSTQWRVWHTDWDGDHAGNVGNGFPDRLSALRAALVWALDSVYSELAKQIKKGGRT